MMKEYEHDKEILQIHKKLSGENSLKNAFIFYENKREEKIIGYVALGKRKKEKIHINWIYGPGFGKFIMVILEEYLKENGITNISLKVSIDPTEYKNDVLHRLNFYISLNFRVTRIKYRQLHGPLFEMQKLLI